MDTSGLPEPICEKCLDPIFNEPLYDNASIGLCPKCFEAEIEGKEKRHSDYLVYKYQGYNR